jgi:hypothetical protein
MITETYTEQKKRHSDEINGFKGLFFAFSNEQLAEGLQKLGLTMADTGKIFSIGSGGYILKEQAKAFHDMFARHSEERKQLRNDNKKLIDALVYELANHEYCITYDPAPALESLDLTSKTVDPTILKKAINQYLAGVV